MKIGAWGLGHEDWGMGTGARRLGHGYWGMKTGVGEWWQFLGTALSAPFCPPPLEWQLHLFPASVQNDVFHDSRERHSLPPSLSQVLSSLTRRECRSCQLTPVLLYERHLPAAH